ncbi:MAG: 30S ribosome-binding factor RbfA [bacterium]|nr:30S ribosome-binding factor RbfA [bacterium]
MKVKRTLRVAEQIKRDISTIISKDVKDPVVKGVIITFVNISDDLRIAKVYYRSLGTHYSQPQISKALDRVTSFVRLELARKSELRFVPELRFYFDSGVDQADRIDYLLDQIKKKDKQ